MTPLSVLRFSHKHKANVPNALKVCNYIGISYAENKKNIIDY